MRKVFHATNAQGFAYNIIRRRERVVSREEFIDKYFILPRSPGQDTKVSWSLTLTARRVLKSIIALHAGVSPDIWGPHPQPDKHA